MDDRRDAWRDLGRRLLRATPLVAGAWVSFAAPVGDPASVERRVLGLLGVVAACVVVAPALAGLAAEPAGGLFYPRHVSPPEPGYSRAEAQRRRGWHEAAMAEYERIVAQFPADAHAYAAMMEIAAVELRDGARLEALARRGLAALPAQADRLRLVRQHASLSAGLRAAASPGTTPDDASA